MTLAGFGVVVRGGASAAPANEIDGINSIRYGESAAMLTTMDFAQTSEHITRIRGLKDGQIELAGDYEHSDAPQLAIRTAKRNGTSYFVRILWDGTNGVEVECLVESFNIEPDVEGKVTFSASLLFINPPTDVP